ncbi:Carboxylesterase 1 [Candidatus Nitrotoga sp. HW29]|uniref:alpha/beta hydrolase n=1 Tax=Candidatus Nitrotoga sp. HW29 TaxID=2886963 RepID=UPI001EF1CB3F|nr:dienelactone hydrolase family protein [Candidatus Nitrotoga sp. HW29]CAH1904554.1 Carboxylesterase 1 [Candidatus Nitrotoga sp. HW29]
MDNVLPHITLETGKSPQHSIIWLHGLGADGEDFVSIAEEMNLPVAVRYLFPHAPKQPVTINGGAIMRAWYDIMASNIVTQQDAKGIRASQAAIEVLIAQEKQRGIVTDNIFLAGFSQGGAIALHTGLRHTSRLGGILALSTYLPLAETLSSEISAAALNTPIFMAHGQNDPIVTYARGKSSADELKKRGYQVAWHEYGMPHSVCAEEVRDIQTWLTYKLNTKPL